MEIFSERVSVAGLQEWLSQNSNITVIAITYIPDTGEVLILYT